MRSQRRVRRKPTSPASSRIARESQGEAASPEAPALPPPVHNPAPLLLVGGLLAGLTLLGVTQAWPNLAAGATVLQTLVAQVSPLAGVGLGLLLAVSALVAWRPTPVVQRLGAGAFVLAGLMLFHSVLDSLIIFAGIHAGGPFGYGDWAAWFWYTTLLNMAGGLFVVTLLRLVRSKEMLQRERADAGS